MSTKSRTEGVGENASRHGQFVTSDADRGIVMDIGANFGQSSLGLRKKIRWDNFSSEKHDLYIPLQSITPF